MEYLPGVVHWALNTLDPPWGVQGIHLHGFGSWGPLAPRIQNCLRELGHSSVLVFGTHASLWEQGPSGGMIRGTRGGLQGLGPISGLRS
jgi:hypothetical protein